MFLLKISRFISVNDPRITHITTSEREVASAVSAIVTGGCV